MSGATRLRDSLIARGHLIPMGVDGLYGTGTAFENALARLGEAIGRAAAADGAETLRFPPAMAQSEIEKSGYLQAFPHLAGTVHCFCGGEREHARLLGKLAEGADWSADRQAAGIALTPAACYPAYPAIAARGPVGPDGATVDVYSYCFRHEPSLDPARLQLFRMREYVRIGTQEQVVAFRALWLERSRALLDGLGLPFAVELANDPFFGRAGAVLADAQRSRAMKFELLVPVAVAAAPTACASFNYHGDRFGTTWGLVLADGSPAHSACVAFGMERMVLALLANHGPDPRDWPERVRAALAPSP